MKNTENCTGCGLCAEICPRKAISMRPDRIGFLYPVIDKAVCSGCGLCDKTCSLIGDNCAEKAFCFGAKAKDDDIRGSGSSGGMFPLLARSVLKDGGCVFGAALAADGKVRHIMTDNIDELQLVTRTKYVQSDLSGIWRRLRETAEEGRPALFCGTPCQTAAVRTYLGGRRGRLILADLICNGVPSPEIWGKYLLLLEKKYGGPIRNFRFRDKRAHDSGHTVSFFAGEREYAYPLSEDAYCRTCFAGVNLRDSCFSCPYTAINRVSDITIGDFWGIEKVKPDFDDGMGCSVVICHTDKGMDLWEQVKSEAEWFSCEASDAANDCQPRLKFPVSPDTRRGKCLFLYRYMPFSLWMRLFGWRRKKPL